MRQPMKSCLLLVMVLAIQPALLRSAASQRSNAKNFSKKQADDFANMMIRGFHIIQSEHVLRMERADMARCTVRGLYKGVNEPLPAMMAKRLDQLTNQENDLRHVLSAARRHLGSRKQLEKEKDLEISFRAIFAKLEPLLKPEERSRYYSAFVVRKFYEGGPYFSSLGLVLESDKETGLLRVVTPRRISPAYDAGIRGGDLIVKIRVDSDKVGKKFRRPRVYSTKGMSVEQAQEILQGNEGTRVKMYVIPAGRKCRG